MKQVSNQSTHTLPQSIGNPAKNALKNIGVTHLQQVAKMTDKELLAIHGVGPKAVRILRQAISETIK